MNRSTEVQASKFSFQCAVVGRRENPIKHNGRSKLILSFGPNLQVVPAADEPLPGEPGFDRRGQSMELFHERAIRLEPTHGQPGTGVRSDPLAR